MKALVLGATGHLGNAITRELLTQGWQVTAPSRRSERPINLVDLPVHFVPEWSERSIERWVPGHALVVDAAAPYHFELDPEGAGNTQIDRALDRMQLLLRSVSHNDARLVYISSFTTLPRERTLSETARSGALSVLHPYFELKQCMEGAVLSASARGAKAVVLNPSQCIGPYEIKPRDFCLIPLVLSGEVPATTTHPINVIDVRDVAEAAVAAAECGPFGEPIPLVGHNATQEDLVATICRIGGGRPPIGRVPATLTAAAAYVNEFLATRGLSALPYPSLGLLLLLEQRWSSPGRSQRALLPGVRPLSRTIAEAVDWYRKIGHLDPPPPAIR